jgi:hypothetical protein
LGQLLFQVVTQAVYQGCFGAHHHQVYVLLAAKVGYCGKVVGCQVYVGTFACCSGISWCDKEFVAEGALPYFPGQCVFAAPASNQQNVHGVQGTPKMGKPVRPSK